MTGNAYLLSDFIEERGPSVVFEYNGVGKIVGYGTLSIDSLKIEKVSLVSGLK